MKTFRLGESPIKIAILCLFFVCCWSIASYGAGGRTRAQAWSATGTMTASDGKQHKYEVKLVDIRMEDCFVISQRVGKVKVRTASGTRIIPGLVVARKPQLLPPKTLFFLHYDQCEIKQFVHYDLESGKTIAAKMPDDLDPYFGPPSLSPSADKIAYITFDREGGAGYRIRHYPGLQLIKASPMRPVDGGDVPWEEPRWISDRAVQFDTENLAEEADKREWNRVDVGSE